MWDAGDRSVRGRATGAAIRLLASAAMAGLVGGCVMPLPAPERLMHGKPVLAGETDFIVAGVTTTQDVQARLGAPQYVWEDARLHVYHWVVRQGVILVAVAPGQGEIFDIPEGRTFIVRFDAHERVVSSGWAVWPGLQKLPDFLRDWLAAHGDGESRPAAPDGSGENDARR